MRKVTKKFQNYKMGEKDHQGRTISTIFLQKSDCIIYEAKDESAGKAISIGDITWSTTNPQLVQCLSALDAQTMPVYMLAKGNPRFMRMAINAHGSALFLCATDKSESAVKVLEDARNKLTGLKSLEGRLHYLLSCMVLLVICVAVTIGLVAAGNVPPGILFYFFIVTCGSLGGFLSVSLNLRKLDIDPEAPRSINIISGTSRILIGMIGAVLVYFLIKANILLGLISQANSEYAILAACIVAGFSETLVPNILRKMEQQGSKS
jgi:hypothetical protein